MRKVVISGPPPMQVLDVTGPLEVLSNIPDYRVTVVSSDGSDRLMTNRGIKRAGCRDRAERSGSLLSLLGARCCVRAATQ